MVGSTKRLYRNSKKVRKMRKSKRTISLGKNNKTGGSRRRIKVRKLKNSRRRRKYKRNFRSKRRGGGESRCEMSPDWSHDDAVNKPTFVDKIVKLGTTDIPGTMSKTLLYW